VSFTQRLLVTRRCAKPALSERVSICYTARSVASVFRSADRGSRDAGCGGAIQSAVRGGGDNRRWEKRTMVTEELQAQLFKSFAAAKRSDEPYRHWILNSVFPAAAADALATLPFPVPDLGGVSGKRELHNATRQYFDADNNARHPVCKAVSEVFQSPATVRHIEAATGAEIAGTYVRVEYAQDIDGFWLEPHTDLGVKKFTMLYYLSSDTGHDQLGTDIYWSRERHFGRSPFARNAAMIFIPGDNTWHGFEKRTIPGVRKSVIINYVTTDWRAREQLAYPTTAVTRG
jgi:hypothetical protein